MLFLTINPLFKIIHTVCIKQLHDVASFPFFWERDMKNVISRRFRYKIKSKNILTYYLVF